jgi:hypothetical protein
MPSRYWVGGTAAWDGTAGSKWAETSGGAGGFSVPTTADDVFFDAASSGTCTISAGNTGAKSIDCTGFTGTIAGSAAITVAGSITLAAGQTYTHTGTVTITGTGTLTTAGKTFSGVTVSGSGITVTLGDALDTSTRTLTVTAGTFDTAGYNVTAYNLSSSNSNTRTILLNSSTVTFLVPGTIIDFFTSTNLTFTAGTSTIVASSNGSTAMSTGGVSFYNVSFTGTNPAFIAVSGSATYNNLSITAPSTNGIKQVTFNSPQTINGTLSTTGTAGNRRVWFTGVTYGIAQTLTVNATPSLTDADFRDIYVVGTAAPISGTRIGNRGYSRGITFSTPKNVYWNLSGAQNWSANGWAPGSGGTPNTDNFPLPQDTAIFDNTGSVTGTITLDAALQFTGSVDMSARTTAMTLSFGSATTCYGSWANGSGTTLSGASTLTFSGEGTKTITSAGKTFSCPITVDAYAGTVELADALNIGTRTLTVTNGTFDTKNYNVTASQLDFNNTNVRTIKLGSSTLTLSGTQSAFNPTNLTFDAGTSTINIGSHGGSFGSNVGTGGFSFYNVAFTSTSAGFSGVTGDLNTFNNLTIAAPASAGISGLNFNGNLTITGTLTVEGASAVRRIFIRVSTLGTPRTLTVGTLSADDCDFRDITIAGTAAGSSPTRAGDCGGNSGITFPAPKTVYWNLSGAQNWSATAWAPSSGGSPDINNFPLAQDTAVFDEAGSVTGTITINTGWNIGTFDASARTSAMTLTTGSNAPFVYGNWLFGTGVTSSSSAGPITFAGRGTSTITSNGVTFGCPITISCPTVTVQLGDALVLASNRTLTLASGTFDAVTYNVTTGSVNGAFSAIKTLKMGSGTWTLTGTGIFWDFSGAASSTNFYKGTANIILSDTSSTGRSFNGDGLSYNKLTIGGATGTSTLTISGNNQFTELASTKTVAHTIALGTSTQTFGKWTVTGTSGNVVTLTGTGTSHVLAGSCTSGIDYLAMGSIGFAATSPGEFYAGANSTGTAAAPVYRTAKPADSTRYWVGGTGNWSDTNRWSTGSGGGGGASVPRSHDDVVFDSSSNATAYTATVDAVTGGIRCKALTIAGPASGNLTLAGSAAIVGIHDDVTLPATGLTRTYTGAITLTSNGTGRTFVSNGVTLASAITVNGVDCEWTLGDALNIGSSTLTVTNGLIDFDTYNVTAGILSSDNSNKRTIDFGSGTTTLSSNLISFGTTQANAVDLVVVSGTSQINLSSANPIFSGNGKTFYNVAFTSTAEGVTTINGDNTFNNLSFTGLTSAGLRNISISADQTISGTFTCSAGTNVTMRHFVRSDTIGITRTLTCNAVSLTDVDFRDITIAGSAAPAGGTRIGDCKGNSGITFTGATTRYWNLAGNNNWSATGWAASSGASPDVNNFPLAQDTCVFESTSPGSGATITINASYNIGTIDMSARTSNTMTLAAGTRSIAIYGNWINGTGITITGSTTGQVTFAGRSSQTITSAGATFSKALAVDSPNGSVTLQDALILDQSMTTVFVLTQGTFDANGYNVTLTATLNGRVLSGGSLPRTLAIGSGTWTLAASGIPWSLTNTTNITGTGVIKLTSASAKTFTGGGIAYTDITLDQGGTGNLTITGNNTFKDIISTASGARSILFGTTTQRVAQWTGTGTSGNVLTITGTSATSPATLILTGATDPNVDFLTITSIRAYDLEDTWYAGANSTNNGSLGWYFEAGPTPPSVSGGGMFLLFM